jgi:nitrile hydratase
MMKKDFTPQVNTFAQLLTDKGVLSAEDLREYEKNVMEDWTHANGAALCARAWVDADFKQRLLSDGRAAAVDLGFKMPEHHARLDVKENTGDLHNVICCTLCSCTAFTIVGMAPGWYKDLAYRARIVREARTVLGELGLHLSDSIKIRVWDTTADTRYMILPHRPEFTAGWSEERLAALITKESLIGVARLEPEYASGADHQLAA